MGTHHAFGQLWFGNEGIIEVYIFSFVREAYKGIVSMECTSMSIPADPILPIAYTEPY